MRCALVTSLAWIAAIAIATSYILVKQILIVPNQVGYMEVRHNDLVTTPRDFDVVNRQEQLDVLVQQVTSRE